MAKREKREKLGLLRYWGLLDKQKNWQSTGVSKHRALLSGKFRFLHPANVYMGSRRRP
jgi:hypothetical protein